MGTNFIVGNVVGSHIVGSNVNQPATVGIPVIDSITDTGFVISCLVTPGSPVTPQLQWGLTTAYSGTPVDATEGEISEATTVHFTVTGATQNSIYHFKVVAGEVESSDATLTTLDTDYLAVHTAMPTKPNATDKANQNEIIPGFKSLSVWDKCQLADIFSTHSADSSCINWKNPGTFNPAPVNSPNFEAYGGYKGSNATTAYVRTNFNPYVNASVIAKDNLCIIIGVGEENNDGLQEFGASDGTNIIRLVPRTNTNVWTFVLNGAAPTTIAGATSAIAHFSSSRNADGVVRRKNILDFTTTSAVGANLVNRELYACGYNGNGTAVGGNSRIRYVLIFSYLTPTEINGVINIMETYLRKYNKGLITANSLMFPVLGSQVNADLTTFVGFENETIHPSVINLGSAWNGYQYWMANTPYPKKHFFPSGDYLNYEIPCIWGSTDGKAWVVPTGLTNPIQPVVPGQFSPDTELFFESNTLYCFFAQSGKIVVLKSTDGITWTDKTMVLDGVGDEKSPAIIKIGATYYMYYVDTVSPGVYGVKRMSCATIDGTYTTEETITVTGMTAGEYPWHIDIALIDGVYWLQILSTNYAKLYIANSADAVTFAVPNSLPLLLNTMVAATDFYRASLMKVADEYLLYHVEREAATDEYQTYSIPVKII